ncbi:hypothetical protein TcasGA2_TC034851 [Tribolium castaneum]|uniref:Uncharacterized protein n=1 Tax=Tribolium castaneum TaxID=7070 RepID=A0A139WCL7_TRICA|nr:hypothetical protein TcasGA2_TC034851 [Tribolium castaneum]
MHSKKTTLLNFVLAVVIWASVFYVASARASKRSSVD